jgi:hypothetical protein
VGLLIAHQAAQVRIPTSRTARFDENGQDAA